MGGDLLPIPIIWLMKIKKERRHVAPENRRDTTADKQKIKKALTAIVCAFLALGLLLGLLMLAEGLLKPEPEEISYDDFRFFEPDYDINILENRMYMGLNRSVYFDRYGSESVLTEATVTAGEASEFFYNYFKCLVNGEYENYKGFFTNEYIEEHGEDIPERFTMQGVYDIHIKLHSMNLPQPDNEDLTCEIYEVSYRIFENNGTFRRDILPDETRTLVFELYIYNDTVKINAIANRANG